MGTTITKSGCLWIVLVIGIFSVFGVQTVKAGWVRLKNINECVKYPYANSSAEGKVCIIYDSLEKVNCYVTNHGIFCMKAEK